MIVWFVGVLLLCYFELGYIYGLWGKECNDMVWMKWKERVLLVVVLVVVVVLVLVCMCVVYLGDNGDVIIVCLMDWKVDVVINFYVLLCGIVCIG